MKCTKCVLSSTSKCNLMGGSGPLDANIMFIADAPGETEERLGVPVLGDEGIVFNDYILPMARLSRSNVYVTYAIKCRPPEDRKPSTNEIRTCRNYLSQELLYIKPRVCFIFGNTALLALFGHENITTYRGHYLYLKEFPLTTFIPTFSPGYCLRSWEKASIIIKDINNGTKLLNGSKPEPRDTTISVVKTIEDLESLVSEIEKAGKCSFDIETTGLDFTSDKILCIGFC